MSEYDLEETQEDKLIRRLKRKLSAQEVYNLARKESAFIQIDPYSVSPSIGYTNYPNFSFSNDNDWVMVRLEFLRYHGYSFGEFTTEMCDVIRKTQIEKINNFNRSMMQNRHQANANYYNSSYAVGLSSTYNGYGQYSALNAQHAQMQAQAAQQNAAYTKYANQLASSGTPIGLQPVAMPNSPSPVILIKMDEEEKEESYLTKFKNYLKGRKND